MTIETIEMLYMNLNLCIVVMNLLYQVKISKKHFLKLDFHLKKNE